MTDRYAVFGNPIAHSKSPEIHRLFAEQTGQDMSYERQLVEIDQFAAAAEEFFAQDGKGLNITLPFKEDAFRFAHRKTERARRAGAVNTLSLSPDGLIVGDNTDGVGLMSDLIDQLDWQIRDAEILVLGAGGAVRGVLGPLLEAGPAQVTLANRTPERAESLARAFAGFGKIQAIALQELHSHRFDLVINGTSASIAGQALDIPAQIFRPASKAYDMMYGAEPTPFLQLVQPHVVATADGLGMLVAQAAEAFFIWRGVRPQVAPVIASLRRAMLSATAPH